MNKDLKRFLEENGEPGDDTPGTVIERMFDGHEERQDEFLEYFKEFHDKMGVVLQDRTDEDYNIVTAIPDYFLFGDKTYLGMLWFKTWRVINNVIAGKGDPTDNLIDLAVYAGFLYSWRRYKKAREGARFSVKINIDDRMPTTEDIGVFTDEEYITAKKHDIPIAKLRARRMLDADDPNYISGP